MLFNSYFFIFLFLPLTLLLFFSAAKYSEKLALGVLFIASLIFYTWCNYYYGVILLGSVTINYFISKRLSESASIKVKKYFLCLGVVFNLSLLGFFKYMNFFIQNINLVTHHEVNMLNIVLPIGISFFTFTQIAFLVDSYRGLIKKYKFLNYALFVTYFPHLIAGPIIHHAEVMPQFEKSTTFKLNSKYLLTGISIFAIGLFKKVVIADYLARLVAPVFDAHLSSMSPLDAWVGALAYTFELYFDFSGYSDMAIGLSLMFGIKLPINFYSPYKATNTIEFWRRWNMTLSRFLRDYLYIPLGGNRKGPLRKYINILITMLLGGLWHGANWTFVMWGFLHGIYLCINHGWIALKKFFGIANSNSVISLYFSKLVTFIAVVIGWVFFRSPDFKTAFQILDTMFLNIFISPKSSNLLTVLQFFSIKKIIFVISLSFIISWLLPNAYQLFSRYKIALSVQNNSSGVVWKPTLLWNFIIAIIFAFGLCFVQSSNVFLYFRF